jgi:hypothetical protein
MKRPPTADAAERDLYQRVVNSVRSTFMSRGWRIFGTGGEPQYRAEKITVTARLPSPPEDAARTSHSPDRFLLFCKAPGEAGPKQFKYRVIPLGHSRLGPSGDVPPGAFIAEFAGQSEFAADVPELFAVIVPLPGRTRRSIPTRTASHAPLRE